MCVNFIHKWRELQFKVNSERRIFEKLLIAILFALRVLARNLLGESLRRNIIHILLGMPDLVFESWPQAL